MTNEQWEELGLKIEALVVDHVNGFIFMAETENDNGELHTIKFGTKSNSMAIGLAELFLHDVKQARDKASEEEAQ